MASKKFDFPEPFLPTRALWEGEKGETSPWERKERKPLRVGAEGRGGKWGKIKGGDKDKNEGRGGAGGGVASV